MQKRKLGKGNLEVSTLLREIENATVQITVQGARYPETLEIMTGR